MLDQSKDLSSLAFYYSGQINGKGNPKADILKLLKYDTEAATVNFINGSSTVFHFQLSLSEKGQIC